MAERTSLECGVMSKGLIKIQAERCKACMLCIEVCKQKCIRAGSTLNKAGYLSVEFDENCGCTGCALCALRCPEVAIEVYREN